MKYTYDRETSAVYFFLSDKPYARGRDLDAERRVDYATAGTLVVP